MEAVTIFWFRRDLRLQDNTGLYLALQDKYPVLPIFIFDTNILNTLEKDDSRVSFIFNQLKILQREVNKAKSRIKVFFDTPLNAFKILLETYHVKKVFANTDYEPYAIERDLQINLFLKEKEVVFSTHKDYVYLEKKEVLKSDGNPYIVYTPYMKAWKNIFFQNSVVHVSSEKLLNNLIKTDKNTSLTLKEIGFKPSEVDVPEQCLETLLLEQYAANRDYPYKDMTSKVSVHLRFGTVSIREVIAIAIKLKNNTFLNELIWREFFIQILWHFPHTAIDNFKIKYNRIKWRNNLREFELWKEGKTGYPIVDAGMKQLQKTGYIHNRVRMIVASFLCKHLLIDWRWGEAHFAKYLLDYDMASNVGNWQWVAGCGVDAAPYFRVFNPHIQMQKFDKEQLYCKKWTGYTDQESYIPKIIEHKVARERCLKVYKEALSS